MRGVWLDEDTACKYAGRSSRTLREWRRLGVVDWGRRGGRIVYEQSSLVSALADAEARYRDRRIVPGWGRGHKRSLPGESLLLFVVG